MVYQGCRGSCLHVNFPIFGFLDHLSILRRTLLELHRWNRMSSITTPLPVGVGYGVVVGIGFFFAAVMCGISQIQASIVD